MVARCRAAVAWRGGGGVVGPTNGLNQWAQTVGSTNGIRQWLPQIIYKTLAPRRDGLISARPSKKRRKCTREQFHTRNLQFQYISTTSNQSDAKSSHSRQPSIPIYFDKFQYISTTFNSNIFRHTPLAIPPNSPTRCEVLTFSGISCRYLSKTYLCALLVVRTSGWPSGTSFSSSST